MQPDRRDIRLRRTERTEPMPSSPRAGRTSGLGARNLDAGVERAEADPGARSRPVVSHAGNTQRQATRGGRQPHAEVSDGRVDNCRRMRHNCGHEH
jgi:hypothetical protein